MHTITMVFVLAQTVAVSHVCAVMPSWTFIQIQYTKIAIKKNYSGFPATSITNSIVILTNLFLQCTKRQSARQKITIDIKTHFYLSAQNQLCTM